MEIIWGWIQVALALTIILLTTALIIAGIIADRRLRTGLQQRRASRTPEGQRSRVVRAVPAAASQPHESD